MKNALLPPSFLFRYSFPVGHVPKLPRTGKQLLGLTAEHTLPDVGPLDGRKPFADVRLGWNEQGLGIAVEVRGKQRSPHIVRDVPDRSDGLHVWIDTRNTQNIHRAGRFCHYFFIFPTGYGPDVKQPHVFQRTIERAREAPRCNPDDIRRHVEVTKSGYLLETWFPAATLHGYDPEAQPRLGFYYSLHDDELGDQYLSAGHEFPFPFDPSLWATVELVGTRRMPATEEVPGRASFRPPKRRL
jgi:hypothetical protein